MSLSSEYISHRKANRSSAGLFGTLLVLMLLLQVIIVTLFVGVQASIPEDSEVPWWETTKMDLDRNRLHDALDITLEMGAFIENGRISILVDFDHLPTEKDELELEKTVDFVTEHRFHRINIIAGTVPVERINEILRVPGVVFLSFNGPVEIMMDETVPEHNVPALWDLGYTGEGMNIAVIDTGIDATHVGINDFDDDPATYDPKVIAFYDSINSPDQTDGSTTPYDDHGHGSHCAGIASGTGENNIDEDGIDGNVFRGIAPGSALIGVKVLSGGGSGSFAQVMRGMEWCIDNREKFNIRAATMSLGGVWLIELTQQEEERLSAMANTMIAEGIALTIAAGNSGTYGSIGTPGNARDVITVGATEKSRGTALYSSRGPTAEGLIKPNVAAIGSNVMSVRANSGNEYTSMSGTSMATPVVAGIMTLILEANPDLDPLTLRSILEYTAEFRWVTHPIRPNNDYGWGFVEADAALEEAVNVDPSLNVTIDPETPTIVFVGNETTGNATRFLVHVNETVEVIVEGNATALEWRAVNGSGWQNGVRISNELMTLPINHNDFTLGNHSIWIRAKGPNGVSAPLHVQFYVEPEIEEEDSEDEFPIAMVGGIGIIVVLAVIAAIIITRNSREDSWDDKEEDI